MRAIKIDPRTQNIGYIDLDPSDEDSVWAALDALELGVEKAHIRDDNFIVVKSMSNVEYRWTYSLRDVSGVGVQFDQALVLRLRNSVWESTTMTPEQVRELVIWQEREPAFLNM